MQATPNANRIHIALFGKTNSGKSSLMNLLANSEVSITSPVRGTTTDPIQKAVEISPLGACTLIDTAGFDDKSILGKQRMEKTFDVISKTDIAIFLFVDTDFSQEKLWMEHIKSSNIPVIAVINKADLRETPVNELKNLIRTEFSLEAITLSTVTKTGLELLYKELEGTCKTLEKEVSICAHLVKEHDHVLLVMPQDIQAPKGRLILPQVQTIRDLLDNRCIITCVTLEEFDPAIENMKKAPDLIITDSQLFAQVHGKKPSSSKLTSFSVLFSRYKGDIDTFVEGAKALDNLHKDSKILIAEACSHKPLQEDIGRVKLPRLLRSKVHPELQIDICSGNDFPKDISGYDLVIHCGACMFNRKHVLSRIKRLKEEGVPITNYGIAIAKLNGILGSIDY